MSDRRRIKQKNKIIYQNIISFESTQKILEQMNNCICKIKINNKQATGFFCKIPFPNKKNMKKVLITNNHIINQDLLYNNYTQIELSIKEYSKMISINLKDRLKYTNKVYDITIIELKENDNINNYLELDDFILDDIVTNIDNIKENYNKDYINQTIYIIQYPESELSVSYGVLSNISDDKDNEFIHNANTKEGSSGSPILNMNNKIIGIHKEHIDKNNYNRGLFLNYAIKDFIKINYYSTKDIKKELLNKFNEKYNTEIADTSIEEINIKNHSIGNQGLNVLSQLEFTNLKILELPLNKINNINYLNKKIFANLEILNLSSNNISDINSLGEADFINLKELNLYNNQISNIDILEKVKFKNLEILNLGHNNISYIVNLERIKFNNLKELNLSSNYFLQYIDTLKYIKFDNLRILILNNNKIEDINTLTENENLGELEELHLVENLISNINNLSKSKFKKLKILNLKKNRISDITSLEKVDFNELKELYLDDNKIFNISNMNKFKFKNLVKLGLKNNLIENIDILGKLDFLELKELSLSGNQIEDISIFNKVIIEDNKFKNLGKLALNRNKFNPIGYNILLINLKNKIKKLIYK